MKQGTDSAEDAGGLVGTDVVAACALSAVPGVGASALARLSVLFGSLSDALSAGPEKILKRHADGELQLRPDALDFLSRQPDLAELGMWAVAAAKAAGARVVVLGDPWYPALLRQIDNPPALLYVRGNLLPDVPRIAVVGARDADDYGLQVARDLAEGLALGGVQVVSGGARGVDAAAHAGALWGQGTTAAVLGCGIDVVYPAENGPLFDRLASGGGAVVSEFPPGTGSIKANFPRRNRTISGLSSAVVVVRASLESGALITANHAAAQGRPIFAVPGDSTDAMSAGPNQLLTMGAARAVTNARELLLHLGWRVPARLEQLEEDRARERAVKNRPPPDAHPTPAAEERPSTPDEAVLDEASVRLWQLLDDRRPLHLDELAAKAQLPVQEALTKLQNLELKGLCILRPGKYYLRR